MDDLFHGARRKIKRADQHILHLEELLNSFLKSDVHGLRAKKDAGTGQYFLEISAERMPEDVPLILGDAIHNLRTSLDFVATEIATTAKRPIRNSKFPFRETKEEVVAAINGGMVNAAPPSVISAIVDEIKPYKGGNDALWALHELDITDKHLLIVPTVSVATITNVELTYGGMKMYNCTIILEGGRNIRFAGGPPGGPDLDLQIQNEGNPTYAVIFSDVGVFKAEPVVATLQELSQIVSGCVDTIAEAYKANV